MTNATNVPTVALNDGVEIPQLGFGVFQIPPEDTQEAVEVALEAGYRHFDTAKAYRNEAETGAALRASGIDRDELFVTTKLWNGDQGRDGTLKAFDLSLEKLGLDHLDLYLIHWPTPERDLYLETWKAFEELKDGGRVRSVGVSNFQPTHLRRLFDEADVVPSINQVELHPYLQQEQLRAFHAQHGIATEAWSPIAQGLVLDDATIVSIGETHGKTPGQVVLRWHLQLGNIVFPKSVTPSRVRENFDIFDFELTSEDLAALEGLEREERTGPDPDTFNNA